MYRSRSGLLPFGLAEWARLLWRPAQELLGLVAALDNHDARTRGHSDRVRAYSQMIAEEMKLGDAKEVDRLNWAALLHDIGKLEVPTEIPD